MCIDCLPRFIDLKMAKMLAKNFQFYIKTQKESQRESIVRVLSLQRDFGL